MSTPSQEPPKPLLSLHTTSSITTYYQLEDGNYYADNNIIDDVRTSPPPFTNIHPISQTQQQLKPFKKSSGTVKYMECLKNHTVKIGGNATDGCGEFMAGGEYGTIEALKCSACNCHRNFHGKIQIHAAVMMRTMISGVYNNGHGEGGGKVEIKRSRAMFTQEHKEKMMIGFAEKAGWKITKVYDYEVRRFCEENIEINRKVLLKVWMHNNK